MSGVRPNGYVEYLSRRAVRGWAYDAANPSTPAVVELVLDEQVVARAAADIAREDLAVLGIGRTNCCFQVGVPAGVPIDLGRIALRLAGSTAALPIAPEAGAYDGVIEQVEDFRVSGWAWRAGSAERVALVLRHGSDDIAEFVAEDQRDDLEQAGFGDGRHGYSFNFRPFSRGHINPRNISVLFKATGERLFDLRGTQPNQMPAREAAPTRKQSRPLLGAYRRMRAEQQALEHAAEPAPAAPLSPKPSSSAFPPPPTGGMSAETLQAISDALNFGTAKPRS